MSGRADEKLHAQVLALLERGPRDVLGLLEGLRKKLPGLLAGREGRLHALLHGMVRQGLVRVEAPARSPGGLARYGVASVAEDPSPETSSAVGGATPRGLEVEDRVSRRIASVVKDPDARARVYLDLTAHRAALEEAGDAKAFGSTKTAHHLLRRVDRGPPSVLFVEGGVDVARKFALHEAPWLLAVVVGLLLLRAFVVEVFVIPTSSMVPTLLVGDRVVVFKPGGKSMPERWTIVTFDRGDKTYVKRVAARGGERIALLAGDVYVNGEITRKDEPTRRALRLPYRRWDLTGGLDREWARPAKGDPGTWVYAGQGLWSGANVSRQLATRRDVRLRDVYATLETVLGPGGATGVELAYGPAEAEPRLAYRLVVGPGKGNGMRLEREDLAKGERVALAVSPADLPAGDVVLELAYVDGTLHASAADSTGARLVTWEIPLGEPDRPRPASVVRPGFQSFGEGSRPISVRLDKDVHYTLRGELGIPAPGSDTDPRDYAYTVPDGHVYLLGDNTYNSEDSRVRAVGAVPAAQLIGPVHLRIWPPGRLGRVR